MESKMTYERACYIQQCMEEDSYVYDWLEMDGISMKEWEEFQEHELDYWRED